MLSNSDMIKDMLTKRYKISTKAMANTPGGMLDVIGPSSVTAEGKTVEINEATIEKRAPISEIIRIYNENIPLSILGKDNLLGFIGDLETIMKLSRALRSINTLDHVVMVPGMDNIPFSVLSDFYSNLLDNNKSLVDKKYSEVIDNNFTSGFIDVFGGSSSHRYKDSETFKKEISGGPNGGLKRSYTFENNGGLKDEY